MWTRLTTVECSWIRSSLVSVVVETNRNMCEVSGPKPRRRVIARRWQQERLSEAQACAYDGRSTTVEKPPRSGHGERALSPGRITTTRTISCRNNGTRCVARRCEARGRCGSSGLSRTESVGKTWSAWRRCSRSRLDGPRTPKTTSPRLRRRTTNAHTAGP